MIHDINAPGMQGDFHLEMQAHGTLPPPGTTATIDLHTGQILDIEPAKSRFGQFMNDYWAHVVAGLAIGGVLPCLLAGAELGPTGIVSTGFILGVFISIAPAPKGPAWLDLVEFVAVIGLHSWFIWTLI